ncbi:MAG: IclR family transcriptional regulator [Clostridiales bacterium]
MTIEQRPGTTVQSVARALTIIKCFEDCTELGISELSEQMGLSKSTIYGLVNTLAVFGYLEQSENKKYRLGLKLFELGNVVRGRMDIRREAHPWCRMLADKYRTTVHLAVPSEGEIIYIDKVDDTSSVVVYSQIGKRAPMHCTGVGKAILAFLPQDYLEKFVFSRPLKKMTDRTITSREKLLQELETVRQKGYAVDDEEIEPGLHCIAAPIFNHRRQPQMALSVSFPYGRLWDIQWEETARDVLYYARQISERLGYIED